MRRSIVLTIIMVFLIVLTAAAGAEVSVTVTDFPCYDFVRAVMGTGDGINMLIKPGTEVHSFDPTPKDITDVLSCDVFVYIGGESDAWAEGIISDSSGLTVRLMDSVEPELEEGSADEYDEHIWTSPVNAVSMVKRVRDALIEADPENAGTYSANAESYITELLRLDGELRELVEGAERNELVFGDRFPFIYLAKEYGLTCYAAFPSCTAQSEPSARVMGELISRIEEDGIPCVYTIELSNGAIARTLSDETGCGIETLHSMQNVTLEEFEGGETYISIMEKNISALEKGLN